MTESCAEREIYIHRYGKKKITLTEKKKNGGYRKIDKVSL